MRTNNDTDNNEELPGALILPLYVLHYLLVNYFDNRLDKAPPPGLAPLPPYCFTSRL